MIVSLLIPQRGDIINPGSILGMGKRQERLLRIPPVAPEEVGGESHHDPRNGRSVRRYVLHELRLLRLLRRLRRLRRLLELLQVMLRVLQMLLSKLSEGMRVRLRSLDASSPVHTRTVVRTLHCLPSASPCQGQPVDLSPAGGD